MELDIQSLKGWSNNNEGFLSLIQAVALLLIAWITGLVKWLVNKIIGWFKKLESLQFQFNQTNNDTLKISQSDSGEYEYSFLLDLTHLKGSVFNNKIYWHLYMPKTLNPDIGQIPGYITSFSKETVEQVVHIQGEISGPIYPHSVSTIFLSISGKFRISSKTPVVSRIPLYYFFRTEFGSYPKEFNKNNVANKATLETMYKLYLEIA